MANLVKKGSWLEVNGLSMKQPKKLKAFNLPLIFLPIVIFDRQIN